MTLRQAPDGAVYLYDQTGNPRVKIEPTASGLVLHVDRQGERHDGPFGGEEGPVFETAGEPFSMRLKIAPDPA